ncbi:MAG TPA: 7TM diverse intracellular signaling domain-containing protein [Ramlibacter sp.]|nr:7TM diverse intracellular signaling domain-containing protein [Ramlibacter sp.]
MHIVAIGFWGAFFGTVALMLTGAVAAFVKSQHRVALAAALTSLLSALFVVSYLGWLTVPDTVLEARLLAHVGILSATLLGLMLLTELGLLREPVMARRIRWQALALAVLTLGAGWLVNARDSLALSSVVAFAIGLAGLGTAIRSARRGDRLARIAVFGVSFMLAAIAGLSWIALDRGGVPWLVHPASALAGIAYLTSIEAMLWRRYSYLIELREVLAQGPRYDPVTRMQSEAAIGHVVGLAFLHQQQNPSRPVMLVAVSIGNLPALERLHGRAALNHALFVCAGRLRRCVPAYVEMARLFDDGFLLVARDAGNRQRMIRLSRCVAERLSQPVALSTSAVASDLEAGQAKWLPQVGVGLLAATSNDDPSVVVSTVSEMSRTARSYASRVACYDPDAGRILELSLTDVA